MQKNNFCLFNKSKVSMITIPKFHLPIMPRHQKLLPFKVPGFEPYEHALNCSLACILPSYYFFQ